MKIIGAKLISVEKSDLKNGTFEFPLDVKIIAPNAFENCKDDLEYLEVPDFITTISESAFSSCTKLKKVKLPNRITNLRQNTFANCTSLEEINLPSELNFINQSVFVNCKSLKKIVIPKGVTSIPAYMFEGCESLENVKFEGALKSILSGAFANCVSLKQIEIPETTTEIKENAFANCTSLKSVKLPSFMGELGHSVFRNCKSLESINIPKGLANIRSYSFAGCENLRNVNFLNSVININEGAFSGCKTLEKIELPLFLRLIGDDVFKDCENLKSVVIQDRVEYMGKSCFENCKSLENVTLSNNLNSVRDRTFFGCENLKNVTLPKSVKTIGQDAFSNCTSLEDLFVPSTVLRMKGINGKDDVYISKEDDGLILSSRHPAPGKFYLKINGFKGDLKFLADHWSKRDMILNEQKDPKVLDFYNKFLPYLDDEKAEQFLSNHNLKFFKQLDIDPVLPNKAELYRFLYNIGAFEQPIESSNKKIDYAQKTIGFILEKLAKNEATLQTFARMGVSMNETGFKKDFTDFFMNYFECLVSQENQEPGFTANCFNRFDDVQRTNTSDHGEQRQLKASIEKFIHFFAFEKFDGVTEETRQIASTVSRYFSSQEAFDNAKAIDEERRNKKIKNNILKSPLKEENPFAGIDKLGNQISQKQGEVLDDLVSIGLNEFSYEWLEKNDPQNFILGKLCSCCAHLHGAGYGIMHASIVNPNVQNLVIRNGNGEIVAKSTLFINKFKGYGVCNNVEVRSDVPEIEKNKIFKKYVLGVRDFANQYNKEHKFFKLKQINVGMGFNDLTDQISCECRKSKVLFTALNYAKYGKDFMRHNGDSSLAQYVIWENSESTQNKENDKTVEKD